MKTKIRILIAFVLLSAASLMILFGSPNTQPSGNTQTEPEVSVPTIVSTSSDNGGMHTLADTVLPSARYGAHIDLNQPSVTLEQLDIHSVTLQAPNQVGVDRSVAVSPNTRAQKFVNPDGSRIIVLIIKSTGASGVGVHFRNFALVDGEEVYVYGTAPDSIVLGPFTDKEPWSRGEFWSGTVDGDTVVIEFYKKTNESGPGFEISEVSHMFTELDSRRLNEPEVLNCERDASCNFVRENNAVARIRFRDNGAWNICTGTLLNDLRQDQCPYFLTANHCVNSDAAAQTMEVYWFYQTTSCNSRVLRPRRPTWYSPPSPDTLLLEHERLNDFSLLLLASDVPSGAAFSGWASAAQPIGTDVFGLHHPGGSYPGQPDQLDSYLRRSAGSITSTNVYCQRTGLVNGYRIGWTLYGLTERGSSGSGLFTYHHKLVGVLSCGSNTGCSNPWDNYSGFANFFSQIREYIGFTPPTPKASPATFVTSNSFKANWKSVCGATGYRLDVATDNSFTNYVTGYRNLPVGDTTSRNVTGLNANTTYYSRVRARNDYGASGNSKPPKRVTTLPDNRNFYNGHYGGLWLAHQQCDANCENCSSVPTQGLVMIVRGGIVETFDGSGLSGPVDANGHFELTDPGCGGRIIGSISQTRHASGTWSQQGPCGCVSSNWYADWQSPP